MNLNFSIIEYGKNLISSGSILFKTKLKSLSILLIIILFVLRLYFYSITDVYWLCRDFEAESRLVLTIDNVFVKSFYFPYCFWKLILRVFCFFLLFELDFYFLTFFKSIKSSVCLKNYYRQLLKNYMISENLARFYFFG